ncbi:MAG: DUF4396 domain-containing protein [Solirubrobacteraceae bacterium]
MIAWGYLCLCFICAAAVAYDIVINHRRQPMGVMNAVYPITALYLGPFALWLYWRWGRVAAIPDKPRWVTMAIEVSHCGSGCTLGDVIAEWTIYLLALTVAGRALFAEYIGDYTLALAFGIVFQYFAIAPMRGLGVRDGLKAAARADFISLTFFEIGLFGWMALMALVFFPAPHHLMPNSGAYWFLMQIGMIVGFVTAWPANVWLLHRGIKVPM